MNITNKLRSVASLLGILFVTTLTLNAGPSITWLAGVPLNSNLNSVIYPVAQATKGGGVNLRSIEIWYSWDDVNWTVFINDTSPNNNNPYYPSGDFCGGCIQLTQTGTLYLKATVIDVNSNQATAITSLGVNNSSVALPSWMLDTSDNNLQKMWWTTGYPGGGDCIGYATAPLGSTMPQTVLHYNSFGVALMSNPSVLKGSFTKSGSTYTYAMYYVANPGNASNSIDETFSNDGVSWITPINVVTTQFPGAYGNGYPWGTIVSGVICLSSSNYMMFFTDTNNNGIGNLYTLTSSNGVTWTGTPAAVSLSGLSNFGDIAGSLGNSPSVAYNPADGCYYMAYAETPSNSTLDLYKISSSQLSNGTWSQVWTIGSSVAMYYKSNPGILKDVNGYIPSGYPEVAAYATSLDNGAGYDNIYVTQLWYYY
jgi:hypothetical protein